MICFFVHIKISYYWFNRQELLQKAKNKCNNCGGKEKAAECYIANKHARKEKTNNEYNDLSKEEKCRKRKSQRDRYHMNTSLNERLKLYQRNYYTSEKIRK